MQVIHARSVSEALHHGLHAIRVRSIKQESRVGDVLVLPHPVMTVYSNPLNRVLFSPMRDANPFFHVMEALWMLAGRNDLPWLTRFNKRFASYSDDGGKTQPGAYGYRWRNYFGYDQLATIITELKNNPQTRRCVLAMWDGGDGDKFQPNTSGDLHAAINGSADVPCNTHAYFDTIDGRLNMTVCCRSNDIIWGAYGANAVHFSFLLEYISAMTGIPMGVYRQYSNNFHLYTNVVPEAELMPLAREVCESDRYLVKDGAHLNRVSVRPDLRRVPLCVEPENFDTALLQWFDDTEATGHVFLDSVATPMYHAYMSFKQKDYETAIEIADRIRAEDWRYACIEWLQRRKIKAELNKQTFTDVTEPNHGAA